MIESGTDRQIYIQDRQTPGNYHPTSGTARHRVTPGQLIVPLALGGNSQTDMIDMTWYYTTWQSTSRINPSARNTKYPHLAEINKHNEQCIVSYPVGWSDKVGKVVDWAWDKQCTLHILGVDYIHTSEYMYVHINLWHASLYSSLMFRPFENYEEWLIVFTCT